MAHTEGGSRFSTAVNVTEKKARGGRFGYLGGNQEQDAFTDVSDRRPNQKGPKIPPGDAPFKVIGTKVIPLGESTGENVNVFKQKK